MNLSRTWVARVWPLAAFQFFLIASVAMLKPGTNALVLSRFSSEALPWLYLAAAIITGSFAALTAIQPVLRQTPGRLAIIGSVLALLFASAVYFEVPGASLFAYLFAEALATQLSLSFWSTAGEAFDAREARRAFTTINGVGMGGAIFGGLSAQVLARHSGAISLVAAGGVMLLAGAVVFQFQGADAAPSRMPPAPQAKWREITELPYARLIAGVVLGFSMITQLTDFVFRERAVAALAEPQMADFFASHQLWTGVFCVFFQFALAEALLKRLGILTYVTLLPVTMGVLSLVAWSQGSVWSAWVLKLFESASSWSLLPVAIQLLYAPLPDASRDRTRRTIDGFLRKVGMGLAGVLLIGLAALVGANGVLALVLALSVGIAILLWRIRPRYIQAVQSRVSGDVTSSFNDAEGQVLLEMLAAPSPETAMRAVDLLEHSNRMTAPHVKAMLAHPHERLQERGVTLAHRLGLDDVAETLEAMVTQAARRPRDAAVWALAHLHPERARVVLPPLLATTDPGLLAAAVAAMFEVSDGTDENAQIMLDTLLKRGPRAPVAERREVARLLGRVGGERVIEPLQKYLDDSDNTVRRVAIASVGEARLVQLVPRLIRFLSWRDERRVARAALAKLGEPVVPLLATTLDDRNRSLALRTQLPRVLREIGTQSAFEALLFSNSRDDPSLHYRVGVSLGRMHEEHPTLTVDAATVYEALERRAEVASLLITPFRDLRASLGDASLLTRVVGDRLDQNFEISFWWLGLLHDPRALRRAHAHLVGNESKRRAWALELVENVLSPEELDLVADQLEVPHRTQGPGDPAGAAGALELLCFVDDVVLRSCAREVGRWWGVWNEPEQEDDMRDVTLKRLFALEGVDIFAQSDVDDLAAVAAVAREQTFRKGERIYGEGDPGDALYVISDGEVEARRDGEVVLTLKVKQSFGETSLFDGAPRVNEVIATADTNALVIDRRDFLDLVSDRPELLAGMFRVLSRQMKDVVIEMATRRKTTDEMPALGLIDTKP